MMGQCITADRRDIREYDNRSNQNSCECDKNGFDGRLLNTGLNAGKVLTSPNRQTTDLGKLAFAI